MMASLYQSGSESGMATYVTDEGDKLFPKRLPNFALNAMLGLRFHG